MCLVGRMRKWKNEKLICLIKNKNEMIENEVGINQGRSQDFSLEGAKLKDDIKSEINLKILINNNKKINKQLLANMNIFHIIKINKQK